MKRERVESKVERSFLTAMITNTHFLAGIASQLDLSLLQTPYVRQIAGWCLAHFNRHGEAPGRAVEPLYHAWVDRDRPDDDEAEAVHDFLEHLSSEYDRSDEINVAFLLGEVSSYLTLKSIARLGDAMAANVLQGDKDSALQAISQFRSVSVESQGFDPVRDRKQLHLAFESPLESVIEFPGDAGGFFNRVLTRDSLVGVQAPEKTGKTFWCGEFAMRALRGRRKVAMFQVGDLSQNQLVRRLAVRMSGRPLYADATIRMPTKIELVEGENGREAKVQFQPMPNLQPCDERAARKSQRAFRRRYKLPEDRPYFMVSVHPMSTINVAGIDSILKRWRHELDYVPDVILIDYADILAPEDSRKEQRHQVNDTWQALRRLSQEWHACVITPTQADAGSYGIKTQTMKNFSNDKRKLAHVTGMLGLNQTEDEKTQQVMRLNWIVAREVPFLAGSCLWVAQCIPLGMAFVKAVR